MAEIRRRKNRPPRDTEEVLNDAKRMIRGFARRVGEGDPEYFAKYRELVKTLREGEGLVVAGLRAQKHTETDIAKGGGMSRRNLQKRWPRAAR